MHLRHVLEGAKVSLPERIRREMEAQRYSMRELGAASGVAPSLLSRYFSGQSALSVKSLEAVLEVLGFELTMRKKKKAR